MSKNPNDKKDINDASLLSAAMVSAPAVGGFAYTLKDMMRHRQFRPPRESSFASAARRIQGYSYASKQDTAQLFHDTGFLRTPQGGAVARKAWQQATGSAPDVMKNTVLGPLSESDEGVFGAIEHTVRNNQSNFMKRAASRFRQNVSAFTRHQQLTGALPNLIRAENFRFPSAVKNASLPPELTPIFNRIRSSLGWGQTSFYSRDGWKERGFGTHQMMFKHGNIEFGFSVPVASKGMMAEGLTQSSMRIAPDVAIYDPVSKSIKERISRHEFLMRDFESSILPSIQSGKLKTSWDVQRAVDDLYERNIHSLQNVPNLPAGISSPGWEAYSKIRSQAIDIRIADANGFRAPDSREFTAAMKAGGFFPSTSPGNLAEARVSTFDPRGWSMTPTAEDLSRRITQANREWRATPDAVAEIMKTKWSIFETQQWRTDMGPNAAPHFRSLYINPDKHTDLLRKYAIGEGEHLIQNTPGNRKALEVFRAATPARLKSVRGDLRQLINGGNIKPGEVLGETIEGTPFTYQHGMKLRGLEEFATAGSGEFYSLYYDETVKAAEHTKGFFGAKGMRRLTPQDTFFKLASDVAQRSGNGILTQGIDMAINMDELKKNPARHNTQMITELWSLLDSMKDRDAVRRNQKLRVFLQNPTGVAGVMEKWATVGMKGGSRYSHEAFVQNLMKFSLKEAKLNPEQFGSVFGAVPYVLGKEGVRNVYNNLAMDEFSFRHLRAMHKGVAGGIAQTIFGGTKEDTGAGAFGSIEPRAFELLRGGHLGSIGDDISTEFMQRLAASNPETFTTHEALTKTLMSAGGKVSASGQIWDTSTKSYGSQAFQDFIDGGGGFLRAPGVPDVYVPGSGSVPGMGTFTTAAEAEVKGKLSGIFHGYAREIGRADNEAARSDVFNTFLGQVGKEHAPSGKGAGSFLRGKGILGSRFLTGVSEAGGQRTTSPFTVGLSEKHAMGMFDEMAGIGDKAAVEQMKQRFLEGKTIGGMVARHPFIGQYSLQPVNFQILRGVDDAVMTLPTISAQIRLAGEAKANPINLSPMVGMAGDLDADIYAAYLVNPDLSHKIQQQFTHASNESTTAYLQHTIRAQLIKAKAAGGGAAEEITTVSKMVADAKKLATAQEWVGRLSNELSGAREAVGSRMSGQKAADARFLLEWLEQVPISGKHLKAQDVLEERMSSFFETIESSLRTRNPERMKEAVSGILRNSDSVTQRLLTQNIRIEEGGDQIRKLTGVSTFRDVLPGIDMSNSVDSIMNSLQLADAAGATEATRMAAGRSTLTNKTLSRYLGKVGGMLGKKDGLMAGISSATQAASNVLGQLGESMIRNKKAVGFGFAGSIALATLLSSPKDTIGPASGLDEGRVDLSPGKAANRMNQESHQGGTVSSLGQPTVPSMMRNSTSIAPGGDSVRMSVKARSRGRTNGSYVGNRVRMASGRNANVNVNVREDASSLNPHVLANKLF